MLNLILNCASHAGGGGRSCIQIVNGTDVVTAGGGGGGADCLSTDSCGGGGVCVCVLSPQCYVTLI